MAIFELDTPEGHTVLVRGNHVMPAELQEDLGALGDAVYRQFAGDGEERAVVRLSEKQREVLEALAKDPDMYISRLRGFRQYPDRHWLQSRKLLHSTRIDGRTVMSLLHAKYIEHINEKVFDWDYGITTLGREALAAAGQGQEEGTNDN